MRDRRERRPKRDPMLLGEPSPSLASLERANMATLALRLERLTDEITRLGQKIERLKNVRPTPQEKIDLLAKALERLTTLRQATQNRLAEKVTRKRRWDEQNRA